MTEAQAVFDAMRAMCPYCRVALQAIDRAAIRGQMAGHQHRLATGFLGAKKVVAPAPDAKMVTAILERWRWTCPRCFVLFKEDDLK